MTRRICGIFQAVVSRFKAAPLLCGLICLGAVMIIVPMLVILSAMFGNRRERLLHRLEANAHLEGDAADILAMLPKRDPGMRTASTFPKPMLMKMEQVLGIDFGFVVTLSNRNSVCILAVPSIFNQPVAGFYEGPVTNFSFDQPMRMIGSNVVFFP